MSGVEKEIGKIQDIKFGYGGYQDAMIGVTFTLGSDKESWGVGDFWGHWVTERSDTCNWTEADRETYLGKMVMRILKLLKDANVNSLDKLRGIPIEATFENRTLKSWRILTEVI